MNVLMTADAVGGVWTYALDLARGLSERGTRVTLALAGPPASPEQRSDAVLAGPALVETGDTLDWLAERPEEIGAAGRSLAALAREVRADIVHLNGPALAAQTAFPCPVVGFCHSCAATWWDVVRGGTLPPEFQWRSDLLARGYAGCDLLAAPSAAFAQATRAAYGLGAVPTVVHNGRAEPDFVRSSDAPPVHAFTAGRLWDDGKNLATLDRAAGRTTVPVLAAGPLVGPNGARIEVRHVRALGSLSPDAVAGRLARRPIFVSLARYEPFGLAVLEAAQHGCALVLADIPAFRELWGGAAIFVEPRDDAAAAAAIDALANDVELRDRQGSAARERAARYGVDRMVEGTIALYAAAMERTAFKAAS